MTILNVYFRNTGQRNRMICNTETNIQHTQGFYKGIDLIPDAIERDGTPKMCPCGVNHFNMHTILTKYTLTNTIST